MTRRDADRFDETWRIIFLRLSWTGHPDVSRHEIDLLVHLPIGESRSIPWLADHFEMPMSTCLEQIRSLEANGYVVRTRDPEDRRRNSVSLTSLGEKVIADFRVFDPDALLEAMDALTPDGRHALLEQMEQLARIAQEVGRRRGRRERGGFVAPHRGFASPGARAQARARADAAGARIDGWALLTPVERDVVAMVGDGLSNAQIADRRLIQRRTVEAHLHHIYAKLGIASRNELVLLITATGRTGEQSPPGS